MSGRIPRDCRICGVKNILKLSNHLTQVHGLNQEQRQPWLKASKSKETNFSMIRPQCALEWSPHTKSIEKWWEHESLIPFRPCTSMTISGCTNSGKTTWVFKLLQNLNGMYVENPPQKILYCYGVYQPLFDQMEKAVPNLTFHQGLPSSDTIDEFTADRKHGLLILGDWVTRFMRSSKIRRPCFLSAVNSPRITF